MTEAEKAGQEPRTDDDEPTTHQSTDATPDANDLLPDETHEVEVPVAVPEPVELDARQRAADFDGDFEDALHSQVTLVPKWLLAADDRREVVYVRLSSETRATLDAISQGSPEVWIRGAIERSLSDVRECVAGSGASGRTLAGPSGVPEEDTDHHGGA